MRALAFKDKRGSVRFIRKKAHKTNGSPTMRLVAWGLKVLGNLVQGLESRSRLAWGSLHH